MRSFQLLLFYFVPFECLWRPSSWTTLTKYVARPLVSSEERESFWTDKPPKWCQRSPRVFCLVRQVFCGKRSARTRLQGFWWTHGHCFISVPSWRAPISSRCFKEIFHPHDPRASPTHCGKTSHWNAACNSSVTLLWMLRPPAFLVARLVTPTSPTNPGKFASSFERIRMGVSVNTHYTNFLHFAKLCWQQYRRCHTTKNISKTNCQFHEHDQTD